jgi:hypothetical protein
MTTFKNNAKYAELLMTYLDAAFLDDTPISVPEVLLMFPWNFKGGSMVGTAQSTRLQPETSKDVFPEGHSSLIAKQWPDGMQAQALKRILAVRRVLWRPRTRAIVSRIATYSVLVSSFGYGTRCKTLYSGMTSIYKMAGLVWKWAETAKPGQNWDMMHKYTSEMLAATGSVSRMHVPTVEENRKVYETLCESSRLPGLMRAIEGIKLLIRCMGNGLARRQARTMGMDSKEDWEFEDSDYLKTSYVLRDLEEDMRYQTVEVGPLLLRVTMNAAVLGTGETRYALGKSDSERLHQCLMSIASAIVGICAQASVGTVNQRATARAAVEVAERNVSRIMVSAELVPLGDEVLVCKGYRRAYTALLGVLAGPMCREETAGLIAEAKSTAAPGVLDVDGFLLDAKMLDAANALNTAKMFKACPAPDVSPGAAMLDRITQIGNGNVIQGDMCLLLEEELKSQILRAYIRSKTARLKLRPDVEQPMWYADYMTGNNEVVPSIDIDKFLVWEGTATMPDMSAFDPANWRDSGIGVDTIEETTKFARPRYMNNMITRLLFDDECPMPGRTTFSDDRVIKFFMKAEGHKDPARGIFSANLGDRQLQSWMEKAVDKVATHHPSYMIGQPSEVRDAKVYELTARVRKRNWVSLYYSFDISGWSAKMPAEPQRISHAIWARLYNSPLFESATRMNEGSHIYLDMEGYRGWYKNTHANLEGFNGKEMTMVLVALLSLAVRRWREKMKLSGIADDIAPADTCALLFAYIDDGLSRIDLPKDRALVLFDMYKTTVIETFSMCGFSVEVTKCFPSDRFAIFLNEVYLAGRHVVHGVRAAMAISSEQSERHNTLIERVSSVATGCRGATMAGLNAQSAIMLMSYHVYMHIVEWTRERDPVVLAGWSVCPRSWGGLGLPNMMQVFTSGSGAAFEEGATTLCTYAKMNVSIARAYEALVRGGLGNRTAVSVLTAPLSGQVTEGVIVDSRVAVMLRKSLQQNLEDGRLSQYAERLLKYADPEAFTIYAESVVPLEMMESIQEQMLVNLAEAHPHSVFSSFARRLEKSVTVLQIVGKNAFVEMIRQNRNEAESSALIFRSKMG